jgi:hypothetical protein
MEESPVPGAGLFAQAGLWDVPPVRDQADPTGPFRAILGLTEEDKVDALNLRTWA